MFYSMNRFINKTRNRKKNPQQFLILINCGFVSVELDSMTIIILLRSLLQKEKMNAKE